MTLMDNQTPEYDRSTIQARKAGWTEADDETLRQMFAAECTFTQMAAAIGKTSGSISRRIKAFGFVLPKDYCVRQMMKARGLTGEPKIRLAVVEFKPEEHTDANVFGIADLQDHNCRFICNDDMSAPVYCGLPMLEDSKFSFCAGHHAICTAPPGSAKEPGRYRP